MTGYGKSEALLENGKLIIEIRSVNGKSSDISIKSSLLPKDREIEVRKRLSDSLVRGSIDMYINWEPNVAEGPKSVNLDLAREYWKQIQELAGVVGAKHLNRLNPNMLVGILLRMPDVVDLKKTEIITEANWPLVSEAVDKAIAAISNYRDIEGEALYKDVTSRVQNILDLYDEVESYESERIAATREKLQKAAEDLKVKVNDERFEQEMIFYLEKLDINEERVRLRQHCKYFMETIDGEPYPGKKLGFIIQEMGREINTTGSKANHAGIQRCVVRMKDELEKIREQSMNIL